MLKLEHVMADYETSSGYVRALDDVSLTIFDNEIVGIAGESGCGKSTLLKIMYGLLDFPLRLSEGSVSLSIKDQPVYQVNDFRKIWWKRMSYIPQGAMNVMNPVRKIKWQFLDSLDQQKPGTPQTRKEILSDIKRFLEYFDLDSHVLEAYPHQLSGGMKQRAMIALATFSNPGIVFADEPTTALDVIVQKNIILLLKRVQRRQKNSLVIVSHDMGVHYQISDKMVIMYAGKIVEYGKTEDIFTTPKHPYTRLLINSLPTIGETGEKMGIKGLPPSLLHPPAGCRFHERCDKVHEPCYELSPAMYSPAEGHRVCCHLYNQTRVKEL